MSKVDWNEAPKWADEYGYIGCGEPVWSNKQSYQYLAYHKLYEFGSDAYSYEDFTLVERRPDVTIKIQQPEEIYTIHLDPDSMQDAVVKFLVQTYKDNQKFREDDGIQDSILDVVRYCSTASEYDSILTELGIE